MLFALVTRYASRVEAIYLRETSLKGSLLTEAVKKWMHCPTVLYTEMQSWISSYPEKFHDASSQDLLHQVAFQFCRETVLGVCKGSYWVVLRTFSMKILTERRHHEIVSLLGWVFHLNLMRVWCWKHAECRQLTGKARSGWETSQGRSYDMGALVCE